MLPERLCHEGKPQVGTGKRSIARLHEGHWVQRLGVQRRDRWHEVQLLEGEAMNSIRTGRKPTGTVQRTKDGRWRARVTLSDGSRQWLAPFPVGTSEAMARERCAALTEQAFATGIKGTGPKPSQADAKVSCEAWVTFWLDERDRRALSSRVTKSGHWRHHIAPVLGDKHPKHWTRNGFRALSAALDTKVQKGAISWKSAQDIWGTATKMIDDACNAKLSAIRCRDDNPSLKVRGPDRGAAVSKQYLFPSEAYQLLTCEAVPIPWARLFAIAIYTYCRASELRALTWADVDLEHNVIRVTKSVAIGTDEIKSTKSKRGRTIPIEQALRPLLVQMHTESNGEGDLLPGMPSPFNLSAGLKRWLKVAEVDRASLTSKGPSERPIRFHDLRATGITWMAVRGDEPQKIQARAGHASFSTTQGYIREAEVLTEGFGEPFGPLPSRLGQKFCLRVLPTDKKSSQKQGKNGRPQRDSNSCYSLERAVSWAGLDDGDRKEARRLVCAPPRRKPCRYFGPEPTAGRHSRGKRHIIPSQNP